MPAEVCTATRPPLERALSIRAVAERYNVTVQTALAWVRSGELRAVHVGRCSRARRPTWRVTEAALAAWEAARTPTPPQPRARRRRQPADVIAWY